MKTVKSDTLLGEDITPESISPVFIIGRPRSGAMQTTRVLGRYFCLFMLGETPYLDDIFSRARQLGDIADNKLHMKVVERMYTLYGRYYEPEDQQRIASMFPTVADLENVFQD